MLIKSLMKSVLIMTLLLINPLNLYASDITSFYTQNQSPLISIFGLPSIGQATVMGQGKGDLRLTLDQASNYTTDGNMRESIVLDGESTRFTLSGRYGIGHQAEVGMEIPFLIVGGGFLDGFIESYHSTFGFPNGGRELAPRNRLLYRYQRDGITIINMERSSQGLGDVQLMCGWQFYESAPNKAQRISFRASLKLPTGDTDSLHGSGSTDLALWVAGDSDFKMPYGYVTLFGAAGAMAMTEGKILPDQQQPLVGFGALGIGYSPADWITLKIQTNAHTSFYKDSDLKQINSASAQLTIGGALAFSAKTSLDIGVTEDIIVVTSPEVVFHLSLCHQF